MSMISGAGSGRQWKDSYGSLPRLSRIISGCPQFSLLEEGQTLI